MLHTHPSADASTLGRTNRAWARGGRKWAMIVAVAVPGMATWCGCGGSAANDEAAAAEQEPEPEVVWRGVPLGDFRIQHTRPLENLKVSLTFGLTASVEEANEPQLVQLVEAHKHRLRDQVIVAVRAAPTYTFDEPELANLRHRIHLRTRQVLEGIKIADIYLTNFDCQID